MAAMSKNWKLSFLRYLSHLNLALCYPAVSLTAHGTKQNSSPFDSPAFPLTPSVPLPFSSSANLQDCSWSSGQTSALEHWDPDPPPNSNSFHHPQLFCFRLAPFHRDQSRLFLNLGDLTLQDHHVPRRYLFELVLKLRSMTICFRSMGFRILLHFFFMYSKVSCSSLGLGFGEASCPRHLNAASFCLKHCGTCQDAAEQEVQQFGNCNVIFHFFSGSLSVTLSVRLLRILAADPTRGFLLQRRSFAWWWSSLPAHSCFLGLFTHQSATGSALFL